jgi:ribosomal protein S18 acetylase RimI-like enzyme
MSEPLENQGPREDLARIGKLGVRAGDAHVVTEHRIERLAPADAARLRSVRIAALRDAPEAFCATLEQALQRTSDEWSAQLEALPTFVASIGAEDVGVVRGGPHDREPDTAFLLSLWVAPRARGMGVGEALIAAVVAWARAAGFARLVLDVADENVHAVRLYARCGFVANGETGSLPPPREHVTEHRRVLRLV